MSNLKESHSNDDLNFDEMLDQNEDVDLIISRKESQKYLNIKKIVNIDDYFKIKCKGYEKALKDLEESEILMLFFGYINSDAEIIFEIANLKIKEIENVLLEIMENKIIEKNEILKKIRGRKNLQNIEMK